MKISEIIKDIFDDMEIANIRHERNIKESGGRINRRNKSQDFGFWTVCLPQIIGFVIGIAFAKLLGGSGFDYVIFGGIGALAFGTYKSIAFDKIDFLPAFVRNIVIMLMICFLFAVAILSEGK